MISLTSMTIRSVPHSGTRFLADLLDRPLTHFGDDHTFMEDEPFIIPLRDPLAIYLSWRQDAKEQYRDIGDWRSPLIEMLVRDNPRDVYVVMELLPNRPQGRDYRAKHAYKRRRKDELGEHVPWRSLESLPLDKYIDSHADLWWLGEG